MKYLFTLTLFLISLLSLAQASESHLAELEKLRAEENAEINAVEGFSPAVHNAKIANIRANYQKLRSELNVKYSKENQLEKEAERRNEAISYQQSSDRNQRVAYSQNEIYAMQQKQMQTQKSYNQEINNTLNDVSNMFDAMNAATIQKEIRRRHTVATNFAHSNSNRIDKVMGFYSQIPREAFNKNISGQFGANLFFERRYSFVNNKELVTEIPCIVTVENNMVTEIFPYGKEGFKLDYPQQMPSQSYLSNGIVKYSDFRTLETITVVLIEPYISENPQQYKPIAEGTGYITLYTKKKKDADRIVWIQELDKKGNIVREVSAPLVYAKDENELAEMNVPKIPLNTGNDFHYFGEPVSTPYGRYPFYMKTSKSDTKPLKDKENRYVRIKKYRD